MILPEWKMTPYATKTLLNPLCRKTCIIAQLFLQTIINIFIQMIFTNMITYLDRTLKEEQNEINLLNFHNSNPNS